MTELLPLAIGVGLAVSLLFSELFGLAAGGMVVPGYIALNLHRPLDVLLTLAAGFVTFAVVHSLASIIIIYGKRRTVLMIIVGYLIGAMLRTLGGTGQLSPALEYDLIGFIIPGLIAIWIDRQGLVETVSALVTAAVVVRLVLVLVVGPEMQAS
ncbi:MAG: poly-gamma-glutamate biosynthesis protein PgsC [Deltaproteobacteria bacterium]|nr:poly-gamma-glutamate biosynthesis protein PgsC [Deltaproteobacteria bacterium]